MTILSLKKSEILWIVLKQMPNVLLEVEAGTK